MHIHEARPEQCAGAGTTGSVCSQRAMSTILSCPRIDFIIFTCPTAVTSRTAKCRLAVHCAHVSTPRILCTTPTPQVTATYSSPDVDRVTPNCPCIVFMVSTCSTSVPGCTVMDSLTVQCAHVSDLHVLRNIATPRSVAFTTSTNTFFVDLDT